MPRTKAKTVVPPLNKSEAEKVMKIYAESDAQLEQINATLDEQITNLRANFADDIQELNEKKKENFKKMQMYAESHPELFKKKKSFETAHGLIGFRTGTPKAKTKKGFTWAAVLQLLKSKEATEYIRTKEEPAKDLFISNRSTTECKVLMSEVGVEVIQDDTFFIDLKKEDIKD